MDGRPLGTATGCCRDVPWGCLASWPGCPAASRSAPSARSCTGEKGGGGGGTTAFNRPLANQPAASQPAPSARRRCRRRHDGERSGWAGRGMPHGREETGGSGCGHAACAAAAAGAGHPTRAAHRRLRGQPACLSLTRGTPRSPSRRWWPPAQGRRGGGSAGVTRAWLRSDPHVVPCRPRWQPLQSCQLPLPPPPHLQCDRLGEPRHAVLGGVVGRFEGGGHQGVHGA